MTQLTEWQRRVALDIAQACPLEPVNLRLRDHFTLHQWREMLGMQRAAECEAIRLQVPYTKVYPAHGSRALVPMYPIAKAGSAA